MSGYAAQEIVVTVAAGGAGRSRVPAGGRGHQRRRESSVTALGIEREERSLGFAVQNVTSEQLQEVPQINLTQALAGKTGWRTGDRYQQPAGSLLSGGHPGGVVIHGWRSAPLCRRRRSHRDYTENQGGFALEYGQAGSRSMDIDMNNVEEMSILRGAAATALYGSGRPREPSSSRRSKGRLGRLPDLP